MILLFTILLTIILLGVLAIVLLAIGAPIFLILFGDLIIFIWIISIIIKSIFKK